MVNHEDFPTGTATDLDQRPPDDRQGITDVRVCEKTGNPCGQGCEGACFYRAVGMTTRPAAQQDSATVRWCASTLASCDRACDGAERCKRLPPAQHTTVTTEPQTKQWIDRSPKAERHDLISLEELRSLIELPSLYVHILLQATRRAIPTSGNVIPLANAKRAARYLTAIIAELEKPAGPTP